MPIFKDLQTAETKLLSLRYRSNQYKHCTLAMTDVSNLELLDVKHVRISREKAEYLYKMIRKNQVRLVTKDTEFYVDDNDFGVNYLFKFSNLNILLAYIGGIGDDYTGFDMGTFGKIDLDKGVPDLAETNNILNLNKICNTSACLLGHMPSALGQYLRIDYDGYFDTPEIECAVDMSWWEYGEHITGLGSGSSEWCFIFDGGWECIDDSLLGAYQRLQYLILWGVPEIFSVFNCGFHHDEEGLYRDTMQHVKEKLSELD